MDRFAQLMGFIMIALTFYVMFKTEPPVVERHIAPLFQNKLILLLL